MGKPKKPKKQQQPPRAKKRARAPAAALESAAQPELEIRVVTEFRRVKDGAAAGDKTASIRGWNRGTDPLPVRNATIAISPGTTRIATTNKSGVARFAALADGSWTLRLDPVVDEVSPGPAMPDDQRDHGLDWNKGNIARQRPRGSKRSFEIEYRPLDLRIDVVDGAITDVVVTSPKPFDRPHHATCFWRGVTPGKPPVSQVLEIDLKADFMRLLDAGGSGVHPPPRKRAAKPGIRLFQIHHTTGNEIGTAINQFIGAGNGIHFLNDRDGHVVRMTDDRYRVTHGGGTGGTVDNAFADEPKINDQAIGVENVQKDPAEFTAAQIAALIGLVRRARELYPAIAINHVVGHCDVFTGKLECPGPCFPWEQLEAAGVANGPRAVSDAELEAAWGGLFAGAQGANRSLKEGDSDRRDADGTFSVIRKGKAIASGLSLGPIALLNDSLHTLGYTPNRKGKKVTPFGPWKGKAEFGLGTKVAIKFFKAHYCRGARTAPTATPILDRHVARLVWGCRLALNPA